MRKELAEKSIKVTNAQLRHYNSLLRKNLRLVISCSSDNEKAQQRVDSMEDLVFEAPTLMAMFDTLVAHGERVFEIDVITICLENALRDHYPREYHAESNSHFLRSEKVIFRTPGEMAAGFKNPKEPILRGGVRRGNKEFFPNGMSAKIKSEALVPLHNGDNIVGVVAFGSSRSTRFLEGFGVRFLKRLARTLTLKLEVFRAKGAGWNRHDGML